MAGHDEYAAFNLSADHVEEARMKTILIVDDNEESRYQLRFLLSAAGYAVATAANGAEALAIARQQPPGLVISDILMPVMDGFSLCREWMKDERLQNIPFVFYTATYTDERDRQLALSLGARQFIVKPEEPERFLQEIRAAIQQIDQPSPLPRERPLLPDESVFLDQYNRTLIHKLESKLQELEQTNRALQRELAERRQAEDAKAKLEAQLRATLYSIGDAVIATNAAGRVAMMNPVAERLTGWSEAEASGRPLTEVFRIINEKTRATVEDPVSRILREGIVIGLANHTLLIARDGREIPIADAGAPIFDARRQITGVVLVFRDQTAERAAQRAVQEARELAENIIATIHDAFLVLDADLRVVSANPAFYRLFQVSPSETVGRYVYQLGNRQWDIPALRQLLETILPQNTHFEDFEVTFPFEHIGLRTLRLNGRRIHGEHGETPRLILLAIEDITEHKQANEVLRRERALLERITSASPAGIVVVNRHGQITFANPQTEKILGLPREVITQRTYNDLAWHITDLDGAPFPEEELPFRRVMATGQPVTDIRHAIERPDGRRILLSTNGAPLFDADGELEGAVFTVSDITEQLRAEQALRESEERYRHIFENSLIGIYRTTPDGRVLLANPTFVRMLGYKSFEELAQANVDAKDFHPEYPRARFKELMEQDGRVVGMESRWNRADGTTIFVCESAVAVRDAAGRILYYDGVVEDITERKRAELALRETNTKLEEALSELKRAQAKLIEQERLRIVGQMASGIAHDFNNALSPILGFCELLLGRPHLRRDDQKLCELLRLMFASAQDAANVVRQLRLLYRKQTEQLAVAPVNLSTLVRQVVRLTEPYWREQTAAAGITVRVELDASPVPDIVGNESSLREAITNLIINAVDALPEGGVIRLKTFTAGQEVVVEVSDNGLGMTEEVQRRCFEPFYSTKGERGTGLGLAMVQAIVHNHGGQISVASSAGKGTTFTLRFPIQALIVQQAETPVSDLHQRPLRILLVDDEEVVRFVYAECLRADGHQVVEAENGPAGLAAFSHQPFDLVITDMAMEGMNGAQVAARLQELAPDTPVILLTGFGDLMKAREQKPPGVTLVLGKPASSNDLRAAIRQVVRSTTKTPS